MSFENLPREGKTAILDLVRALARRQARIDADLGQHSSKAGSARASDKATS